MRVSFTKMHDLGNNCVVFDARDVSLPAITAPLLRALADAPADGHTIMTGPATESFHGSFDPAGFV